MSPKPIFLVCNPTAGGHSNNIIRAVATKLRASAAFPNLYGAQNKGHAVALSREFATKGDAGLVVIVNCK